MVENICETNDCLTIYLYNLLCQLTNSPNETKH